MKNNDNLFRILFPVLLIAALMMVCSCNKQYQIIPDLKIGEKYNLKPNTFRTTDFQPVCPCRLDSLYIGLNGVYYANIYGHPNRDDKATYTRRDGSSYDSVTTTNMYLEWPIPRDDLKR